MDTRSKMSTGPVPVWSLKSLELALCLNFTNFQCIFPVSEVSGCQDLLLNLYVRRPNLQDKLKQLTSCASLYSPHSVFRSCVDSNLRVVSRGTQE